MSLFPLCTRVMLRTLLAMLLALAAVVAGVAWHEVQSSRLAQRPRLLGLAFAGAGEIRGLVGDGSVPAQFTEPMEQQLRARLQDLAGPDDRQAATVVEVVRRVPEAKQEEDRFTRASVFTLGGEAPTDGSDGPGQATLEAIMLQNSGSPGSATARSIPSSDGASPADWIVAAVAVTKADGAPVGALIVRQRLFGLADLMRSRSFLTVLGVAAAAGLLPGLLLAIAMGRSLALRTRRLTNAMLALRQGLWNHRLPHTGFDELAEASRVLNDTFEHLHQEDNRKREALEESLRAKKLAEAGTAAKSDFLANMSHEIRTPMNGIIGSTSLLLDTPMDAEQGELVRMIRTSGESLLHLINDILDFSKLESSKMQLEQMPVNLETLFADTMSIFAFKAADKGIELNHHIAADVPRHLTGDFQRLKQVLVNLVGNAIKFTSSGEILVLASQVTQKRPDGGDQPFLQISVRDTGIGIPADKITRLFEAFTQADESTTRKFGGTGLGLAISRKLCHLMGGSISVASQEGVGSNFYFEVPLRVAPEDNGTLAEEQQWLATVAGHPVRVITAHQTTAGLLAHYCGLFGLRADVRLLHPGDPAATILDGAPPTVILDTNATVRQEIAEIAARARSLAFGIVGLAPIGLEQLRQSFQSNAGPRGVLINKPVGRRDLLKALAQAMRMPAEPVAAPAPPPVAAAPPGPSAPAPLAQPAPQPSPVSPFLAPQPPSPPAAPSVPPVPAAVPSAPPSRSEAGGGHHPARILLVEDQPVNQKLTRLMLNRLGYDQVDLAENGQEAVDLVGQRDYDVVLMDLQMPVRGGQDATREIRGNLHIKHQPVIVAVTGHALTGVRESCYDSGMNEFLTKPVSLDTLRDTLSRILPADCRS